MRTLSSPTNPLVQNVSPRKIYGIALAFMPSDLKLLP